jgi:hypothetical protein
MKEHHCHGDDKGEGEGDDCPFWHDAEGSPCAQDSPCDNDHDSDECMVCVCLCRLCSLRFRSRHALSGKRHYLLSR